MDLSALYPSSIGSILTYPGSLTTPGCNEIVTWVIISEPLEISTRQVRDGEKDKFTVQPLIPPPMGLPKKNDGVLILKQTNNWPIIHIYCK